MARNWPPYGDGLAADREGAIAAAEDAFELMQDVEVDRDPDASISELDTRPTVSSRRRGVRRG